MPKSPPKSARARLLRGGFTLIEVILALTVFAAAATVILAGFTNALQALWTARERPVTNDDLRFVRREILQIGEREAFEEGGSIETLASGMADWETEIEPAEVLDLFRVRLTVRLDNAESGERETHVQELYLLRPGWMEAEVRGDLLADKQDRLLNEREPGRFR